MNPQLTTLSNGLRIVTRHMPGLHSASVGVWIDAGNRDERVEQNGIAHFLEHMAFKGTATRSSLQIAESIENVGGYLNAYTSRDTTAYYARVLGRDVPLALDVLSDIVLHPAFEKREIEVERGVILSEIGQTLDTPDDVIFDWLQEAAYPDQPIGRSILGPAERVRAFSRDDLAGFVAEHYAPQRMIVSAAGAVDHDKIVAQCEAAFGGLARGPDRAPRTSKWSGAEQRHEKDLEQAHFAIALEGTGYHDPDFYAAQIFATALGGGMSSRLFQKVREENGLCYTIFAQPGFHVDTGMLTIYAGTAGEDIEALAGLTMDELRRAADGFRDEEIARAKAQMSSSLLMGLESSSGQAERMARSLLIWDRVPDPAVTAQKIEAVTAAEIRTHAQGLLGKARPALALYGPVANAPSLDVLTARLVA